MNEERENNRSTGILPIVIGKDSFNNDITVDLFKLPHLLIAGAIEQENTDCLNSIIASLICNKESSELKFVFIDPKMTGLFPYHKLNRSFIAQLEGESYGVITDPETAKRTLDSLNEEKDNRYTLLHNANVKSIDELNDKYSNGLIGSNVIPSPLPYIVIAIDEIADLIYTLGEEFEHSLYRIAVLGRAVGIHLVITTQRPSNDVLTDRLKANLPARIAFMMNETASVRIINCEDAAYLKNDDRFFVDSNSINCLNGDLIKTPEVEKIIESVNARRTNSQSYHLPSPDNP